MNEMNAMSKSEKKILKILIKPSAKMEFPIKEETGADGIKYSVYQIPKEKIQEVVEQLNPFVTIPEKPYCLHEKRFFSTNEAKVIRYSDRNIPVSPDFLNTGGMCVDWIDADDEEEGVFVNEVRGNED